MFISFFANAQTAWERPYGGSNNPFLNDLIQTPGNFYFVCGYDTSTTNKRALLAKLDSAGNKLWEKYYSVQDSDYWFDKILYVNNSLVVQSGSYALVNGYYAVPKILKYDTAGVVLDSVWTNINGVYNQTVNMGLYTGANQTYWAMTYIGTPGISNEIHITRRDDNLDSLHNIFYGAFYDSQYSFNKKGEMVYDQFIDEYDPITGVYQPDHISLFDSSGNSTFDTAYIDLPPSRTILRTEDSGFSLFYKISDSLMIRHFDASGIEQYAKYYIMPITPFYPPVPASDSGYFLVAPGGNFQSNLFTHTVLKFNDSNDTLWTQTFARPYVNSCETIKPTSDGGAIVLFRTLLFGDSINYLVKLGGNGERFPFSLQINPSAFCFGDTVRISTLQTAASYLWSTGDTSAILNVTTSGSYSATVTDTAGIVYSIHPVPIQFDSLQPVVLNDVHTCQSSIQLNQSAPGATTYWGNESTFMSTGPNRYFSANVIPDTMLIWVMELTPGGCRTIDSAFVFFDDCTSVPDLAKDANVLIIRSSENTLNIEAMFGKNLDQVELFDLTGKLLKSQSCDNNSVEINISSLSHGLYLLKCSVDGEMVIRKIVL